MPTREDFSWQTGRFRPELTAHCYRMLGSVHDAEDLVQETYLRAWRSYDGFEGRSSLRTWLYRIATSACLRELENRGRRVLPSALGPASPDPDTAVLDPEAAGRWIEPAPDGSLGSHDPESAFATKQSVRLAVVAAMQQLPARQRAVLLLRDVVAMSASEVAELLDTTPAAVNSALQRARAQLARAAPSEDGTAEPADARIGDLVDRYVAAFERADVAALTGLLRSDVRLEMPPMRAWFSGRAAVSRFLASRVLAGDGGMAMVRTRANGQPALAAYRRGSDGVLHAHAVSVLTPTTGGVAHIVAFLDPGLFHLFGLPDTHLPDTHRPGAGAARSAAPR